MTPSSGVIDLAVEVRKIAPMPRRIELDQVAEPFELPKIRAAWAKVEATTLSAAARRFNLAVRGVKHRRHMAAPGRFPEPLHIEGTYMGRVSVFSGVELALWVELGYDLRKDSARAAKVRAGVDRSVAVAQPMQLTVAGPRLLPDVDPRAAVSTMRVWRGNRHSTGFPEPLLIDADYTIATSLFSWPEIEGWWRARQKTAQQR